MKLTIRHIDTLQPKIGHGYHRQRRALNVAPTLIELVQAKGSEETAGMPQLKLLRGK